MPEAFAGRFRAPGIKPFHARPNTLGGVRIVILQLSENCGITIENWMESQSLLHYVSQAWVSIFEPLPSPLATPTRAGRSSRPFNT